MYYFETIFIFMLNNNNLPKCAIYIFLKQRSDYYVTKLTDKLTGKDGKLELQKYLKRTKSLLQAMVDSPQFLGLNSFS